MPTPDTLANDQTKAANMAQMNLPTRTRTDASEEDAVPSEDTSEVSIPPPLLPTKPPFGNLNSDSFIIQVTRLFNERLQAYKHACGYLEDYITQTEKMQAAHTKEYEKVLKTVSNPLKEADHFDQQLGGIAGMFDNIRSNTQGVSHTFDETSKALKSTVLPIFQRLHAEIKNKQKELSKGVGKGTKTVDKARSTTQKHIEALGQNTAMHDAAGRKPDALNDPYVLQRGVYYRLHKQIQEENNARQDLLVVQGNFSQFEAHIVETFQQGMGYLMQSMSQQFDRNKSLYGNMVETTQHINPLFEWNGFVKRKSDVLIDPNAAPRSVNSVPFPNQNHNSTQPLIQGSLERKGTMMRKFDASYCVVTPTQYLHEFKTDDNFSKDPAPELSLHLPDCTIGALNGNAFNIKGKDVSGGKMGSAVATTHEYAFRAHSSADAEQWYRVISDVVGNKTSTPASSTVTSPTSPSESGKIGGSSFGSLGSGSRNVSGSQTGGAGSSAGAGGLSGVQGQPGQY